MLADNYAEWSPVKNGGEQSVVAGRPAAAVVSGPPRVRTRAATARAAGVFGRKIQVPRKAPRRRRRQQLHRDGPATTSDHDEGRADGELRPRGTDPALSLETANAHVDKTRSRTTTSSTSTGPSPPGGRPAPGASSSTGWQRLDHLRGHRHTMARLVPTPFRAQRPCRHAVRLEHETHLRRPAGVLEGPLP